MSGLDPLFKAIFGNTISIVLRIIGFTLFGVVLNVFLVLVQWEIVATAFSETVSTEKRAVGFGLILAMVLFPIVYFLLGQKQGFQNALSNLLKNKKYDVIYWLVNKLHERRPEFFGSGGKIQVTSLKVVECLTEVLRDVPGVVVKSMRYLIDKVRFSDKFVAAINEVEIPEGADSSCNVEKLSEIISNMIPGDIIKPDIKIPFMVFAFNVSFFFI